MRKKQPIMKWISAKRRIPRPRIESAEYERWRRSPEKELVDRYFDEGQKLVNFTKKQQAIIIKLTQKYGYVKKQELPPIMEWIRANGRIPQRKLETAEYEKWMKSTERKLVDRYFDEGQNLGIFNEEQQAIIIELTQKYGYVKKQKPQPIMEWIRANGRIPQQRTEIAVYEIWMKSTERKLVDRYFNEGQQLENFTDEEQAIIKEITGRYGYVKMQVLQPIMDWVRENGIPNQTKNPNEYARWYRTPERKLLERYFAENQQLGNFTKEEQSVINELKGYGYRKVIPVMEWIRANKRIPVTSKEHAEYERWRRSPEKKLVDRYFDEGQHIESFTVEQQAIIKEITERYGYIKRGLCIKTEDIGKATCDSFAVACNKGRDIILTIIAEQQKDAEADIHRGPGEQN